MRLGSGKKRLKEDREFELIFLLFKWYLINWWNYIFAYEKWALFVGGNESLNFE